MKNILSVIILFMFTLILNAQSSFSCGDILVDKRDNQEYKTVLIGTQCWMQENLNMGKMVKNMEQANNEEIEKTCYENYKKNCKLYGGLYTWDEAMMYLKNESDICPSGWHIPSNDEWSELNTFLGTKMSGQQMKVTKDHIPGWDGNNSSSFTAIPSGVGYENRFGRLGFWAIYWSSSENGPSNAWSAQLDNFWSMDKYPNLYQGNFFLKTNGFSIRCIKNKI